MKIITFSLQTQQPLLATSFQGDPNSDVSYSYIPGSMIRGAVIGRYIRHNNLSELDLENDEVKRLFFDANNTLYLNGYLQSNEGKRTLPVLRSWFKEKDAELSDESPMPVYDFGIHREHELESPKFIGEGFWTKGLRYVNFYKEKRRINIHNRRDRKQGRSTQIKRDSTTNQFKGEGEIFRYEAIDSGQTFQAVILSSSDDAQLLIDLLDKSQDIWLGGSQTAGYGHTKISNINSCESWDEVNISVDDRTHRDILTITLLSDLILRDKCGQYAIIPPSSKDKVPAPLTKEIEKILDAKLNPQISYASSTLVGGFNRKWGLPLPQVPALAAGSIFVFDSVSITSEQIKEIEAKGIGERRTEGFGRVAVNWLKNADFEVRLPKKISSDKPELKIDTSQTLAKQMADRLLHQKVEQTLQRYLGRTAIKGDISNSQLSRLQLVVRQALPTGDCELVLSLLNNLTGNANSQFEKAKIGDISLNRKLSEWLRNSNSWSWVSNKQDLTVTVANVERSINDEFAIQNKLAEKSTLRLIMALAKKAIKEDKK
ncbi:MAG: hypothetical protein KME60_22285 [Cyanomargarita calcarea GSE-NOS-MK-12-04C]|jgi:CRISPR-associated protein Csx10|uniref:CRISPR type III-associated protein domain-containing protein n=1 Tax=Cyanomargarita calcarea GSE-NOS-MK-12-04C TaxID=2839659 RepID=A0A951UTU0_9CYAN|nr:hypothetical protein [Cyanomargarita calcarea GSE-NOS-MK-12-04C]